VGITKNLKNQPALLLRACSTPIVAYPSGQNCQKTVWRSEYTPTDCFFGDFAHWDCSLFTFAKSVETLVVVTTPEVECP